MLTKREDAAALEWHLGASRSEVDADTYANTREALLQLRPREERAVRLRFWGKKSHRDIARSLGLSEAVAKKILTQALLKLESPFFAKYAEGRFDRSRGATLMHQITSGSELLETLGERFNVETHKGRKQTIKLEMNDLKRSIQSKRAIIGLLPDDPKPT